MAAQAATPGTPRAGHLHMLFQQIQLRIVRPPPLTILEDSEKSSRGNMIRGNRAESL